LRGTLPGTAGYDVEAKPAGAVDLETARLLLQTFQKPRRLQSKENPLAYARGSET
jgi:hypothetical protein